MLGLNLLPILYIVFMKISFRTLIPILILSVLFSCSGNTDQGDPTVEEKSYQKIHEDAVVIDGHNDYLFFIVDELIREYLGDRETDYASDLRGLTHLDLDRQKAGGLDVQFFSVFCLGSQEDPFDMAIRQIDSMDAIVYRNSDLMALVTSSQELRKALDEKKSIAMMGVEGGHMMEDDLDNLETFYERGVRYMTLTWNNSTSWATSSNDEAAGMEKKGLTDFGREVVRKMNDLGMIVDISHVGEQTFQDVMDVTSKPVIASHSSVYNLCNYHRNLKDYQLKDIAENNGVAMVNFYPGFIDSTFWKKEMAFFEKHQEESDSLAALYDDDWLIEYHLYRKYPEEANEMTAPLSVLIDHIDYIVQLIGIDHVGLGSDFDGITITPRQLDDVTDFPLITKALLDRGYSEEDVRKILGENFIRVLKANEESR